MTNLSNGVDRHFPLKPTSVVSASIISVFYLGTPQLALADLNNVPGLNGVQTSTAAAVQTICPQMAALNADGALSDTEQQLFFRCRELVQTSNEQQGVGGTAFSLGLTEEELATALQAIAPEETEILGAGVTDASQDQLTNLKNRMQELRGVGVGPVSGLSWSFGETVGGAAGDDAPQRWGVFVNGIYGNGERDKSLEQDGFEYDAYGITAGVDYRFDANTIAGVALGYSDSDVDIDDNLGDFDTDGYSVTLYGTWYKEDFYVEGSINYGAYDYTGSRNIAYDSTTTVDPVNQTVRTDTDGDQFAYSIGAGYNGYRDAFGYTLFGRVDGLSAEIDAYSETGSELAMQVSKQDIDSLQLVLGVLASYTYGLDFGVLTPYIGWEQRHETDDNARPIEAVYVFDPTQTAFSFNTEDADKNYGLLSLGASLVLTSGSQLFINYDTVVSLDNVDSDTLTVGWRMEL